VVVRFVLWSLADSKTNLAELRQHLPPLPDGDAWISDEATERFGLISFSGETDGLERIRDLIGKEPEIGETFDLEQA
jgi:hypothetical protein